MTDLEQFAPDPDAAPPRVVPRHLQDQLLEFRIEAGPTGATPPAEGRLLSPHQLAMPSENRLWLDKHPD